MRAALALVPFVHAAAAVGAPVKLVEDGGCGKMRDDREHGDPSDGAAAVRRVDGHDDGRDDLKSVHMVRLGGDALQQDVEQAGGAGDVARADDAQVHRCPEANAVMGEL